MSTRNSWSIISAAITTMMAVSAFWTRWLSVRARFMPLDHVGRLLPAELFLEAARRGGDDAHDT